MKKTLFTILTLILTVAIGAQVANAIGSLIPSGTAGDDTHYSLNDIYDKLTNFSDTPTATSSPFTTPGSASASFRTLTEIYDLLTAENTDLVPQNIATGTSIFGIDGTLATSTPELQWSTAQGSMNWTAAVSTCATLTEGGAIAGDWRLPNIDELLSGIAKDWIIENDNTGDHFLINVNYWSSSSYFFFVSDKWYAGYSGGIETGSEPITSQLSVLCVR